MVGAFAVTAAMTLVVVACTSGTQAGPRSATTAHEPPAASPSDDAAERVALGFLEALGAFDVERASVHLAEGAAIRSIGEQDDLRLLLSWLRATGYRQNLHLCRASDTSRPNIQTVHCTFDFHALRSERVGRGPFRGSSFDLVVRDGRIVRATQNWNIGTFSPQVWEPFARWLSKAHPEDVAVTYQDPGQSNVTLSPESIARWKVDTREYAAANGPAPVKIAEAFMRARDAHDAEKAMSLLADDGVRAIPWRSMGAATGSVPLGRRQLVLALDAERLLGLRFRSIRCRRESVPVSKDERRTNVVCDYAMDSRLRHLAGLGPTDWVSGLRIHDGRVDLLSFPWMNISWNPGGYQPAEAERFVRWLGAAHPEAIDVEDPMEGGGWLFRTPGQEWILRLNPRTLELLAGYLREYERSD
jgi:hypothetical protein